MVNTWISETENYIEELQITQEDITGFQEKQRRKTGAAWSEERREKHKERKRDKEGKEKGRKEGRKEGKKEGRKEGRKQLKQT